MALVHELQQLANQQLRQSTGFAGQTPFKR